MKVWNLKNQFTDLKLSFNVGVILVFLPIIASLTEPAEAKAERLNNGFDLTYYLIAIGVILAIYFVVRLIELNRIYKLSKDNTVEGKLRFINKSMTSHFYTITYEYKGNKYEKTLSITVNTKSAKALVVMDEDIELVVYDEKPNIVFLNNILSL
jgi:hypothetical protein